MRNFISAKRHVTCETVNKSFRQKQSRKLGIKVTVFLPVKGQRHLKTKHIQQVMEYAVICFFMDKRDGEYEEAVKWTWKHKSVHLFMRH